MKNTPFLLLVHFGDCTPVRRQARANIVNVAQYSQHTHLGDRLDIEHGGKIVLPPSAIEDLASQEFGDVNNFDRAEDTTGEFCFLYFSTLTIGAQLLP
jgi:hypothetical protein